MLFRITVVFVAFAATVLATPYKRASDLVVKVTSAAASFNSVGDLKFTASVTNTGSETIKILKYGTILDDKLPTKSFTVTKDDVAIPFTGIKLSVSLIDVDESAFAIIPAGETVTATHDVSALYDFFAAGPGKFSFIPKTDFVIASTPAALVKFAAPSFTRVEAAATAVEVDIKGDLARREIEVIDRRAKNICTTSSKKTFIDSSYSEAKTLAKTAVSYISSKGSSDSLYKAYFGTTATSKITGILNAVANENSSSRTLSCVDTYNACSGGVIAYTVTSTTNIYYCSIFFNEVATSNLCSGTTVASRNVRGGTTLHELTHALGGTDDITYGCSADQGLSTSNKALNADNYNCFTTQVYANTKC